MTVYFIRPVGVPDQVKIGFTNDLPRRLQALGTEFANGVELLAQCDGGTDVERAFHETCKADWRHGEWFSLSPLLASLIHAHSHNVAGRRIWGRLRAVKGGDGSPVDQDRQLAKDLLHRLFDRFGLVPIALAQSRAFEILAEINPIWSRRRVRAIWEKSARRIDYFEIRDIQSAIDMFDAPRLEAMADEIQPELREQMK